MCLFPDVWEFDQNLLSFTVFEKYIGTFSTEISMICRGKISLSPVATECAWPSACLPETTEIEIKHWVLLAHFSSCHLRNLLLLSRKNCQWHVHPLLDVILLTCKSCAWNNLIYCSFHAWISSDQACCSLKRDWRISGVA